MMQGQTASEPLPQSLDRVRRGLWSALLLALATFTAITVWEWLSGAAHGLPYLRLGASSAAACGAAVLSRMPHATQFGVLWSGALCSLGIYAAEAGLRLSHRVPEQCRGYGYHWKQVRCQKALESGHAFDGRSTLEKLDEVRETDPRAVVAMQPMSMYLHRPDLSETLLPLASMRERQTIFCNEDGVWHVRHTDEYGFYNPTGLYGNGRSEIMVVGDSYAAGFCVYEEETVAAKLRQDSLQAVTLGVNANGPLAELATLREYGPEVRSHDVYLLFYEGNDLRNLELELRSPLARYLDPEYSQHLVERADEVEDLLERTMADIESEARRIAAGKDVDSPAGRSWASSSDHQVSIAEEVESFITLRAVKALLDKAFADPVPPHPYDPELLEQIFRLAKQEVDAWHGQLTLVYLPTWYRYVRTSETLAPREDIIALAREAGLEVLDFSSVLDEDEDPLRYFPYRSFGHYTADGYAKLAHAIAAHSRSPEHIAHAH